MQPLLARGSPAWGGKIGGRPTLPPRAPYSHPGSISCSHAPENFLSFSVAGLTQDPQRRISITRTRPLCLAGTDLEAYGDTQTCERSPRRLVRHSAIRSN